MDNLQHLIIDSEKKNIFPDFKELIRYKDLFMTLASRDFKIRYAQTFIGVLWAFVQPVATLLVLYVVFGRFAKVDTGNIPHIIFTACGTCVWAYFSYVMTNSGNSIISAQDMVKKVYFPRLILPISVIITNLLKFVLQFLLFFGILIYYL